MGIGNAVSHSGSGRRDRRRRYTSQASAARTAAIKNSSTGQPEAAGQTVVKAPVSAAVAFVCVPTRSRAAWIAFGHPTRRAISRVIPMARARTAHQEKAFGGRFALLRFRRRSSTLPTRKNADRTVRRMVAIGSGTKTPARDAGPPGAVACGIDSPPVSRFARLKASAATRRTARTRRRGTAHANFLRRSRNTSARRRSALITIFPEGPGCADQAELSSSKKRFRLRSP